MAAGEYVSVSSQADTEQADIERERKELAKDEMAELAELAAIYVKRGLDPLFANHVAEQLTAHDAIRTYREEERRDKAELARLRTASRISQP